MQYSGSGIMTANATAVAPVNVPIDGTPAGTTTSGCDPANFAGFPAGNIALVQRGTCTFGNKAANAAAAGTRPWFAAQARSGALRCPASPTMNSAPG